MVANEQGWLVENSPSLLLVLDEQLICRGMAMSWRQRLDPSLAEKVSIPATELFDFNSEPQLLAQFEALGRDGVPITNIAVGLLFADRVLPARIGAWRAIPAGEKEACIVVAATDVSMYEDAVKELERLKSEHTIILESAGEGVYGLDAQGKITFGNAATVSILGWRLEEVIGHPAHGVHHHSHADGSVYPREECPIYAALTDGEVHRIDDEVFWHADGSAIPVEYTSTPILKDGKPNGAVVIFRDISERKKLEAERTAAFEQVVELKEQLELERDYLRDEINLSANFGEIIGDSPALKRTMIQIDAVATTPANVLVLGESGTGKEMVARAIHSRSDRADNPLVKVNCASIPKDLFESEFFGHVKGAFTGAHRDRVGRLQLAAGGTLFLDEVGEIPLSQQGKLLRALQEHEFEKVGDEQTIKVDVRIVAATNRDLTAEVKAGRFREDLFYRLSVFPIEVPNLRDRLEDVGPLALHFLETICRDFGRDVLQLSQQQLTTLKAHHWPGNIRELKNVIERAVISSSGSRLRLDLAIPDLTPKATSENAPGSASLENLEYMTDQQFREMEKSNFLTVLNQTDWRVWGDGGAAELLGLKASTFTYRMKQFGLKRNL